MFVCIRMPDLLQKGLRRDYCWCWWWGLQDISEIMKHSFKECKKIFKQNDGKKKNPFHESFHVVSPCQGPVCVCTGFRYTFYRSNINLRINKYDSHKYHTRKWQHGALLLLEHVVGTMKMFWNWLCSILNLRMNIHIYCSCIKTPLIPLFKSS